MGRFLPLVLMALGVFGVVYLLFGDSLSGGWAGASRTGPAGSEAGADLVGATTGLEGREGGPRRKTAAEREAEARAKAKADREALRPVGVHGVVMDGRGAPVAKATVLLFEDPPQLRWQQGVADGAPLDTTTTNEKGEYIVGPSPAEGWAKVRAEAPGYAPTIQRVRMRGARADLVLDRGGALKVKLLDEAGARVAGARVIHQAGTVVTAMTTGEDGMVHFAALPTGTGSLLILKPGLAIVRDANVAVAPGETEERTLIVPAAVEVEGTVVDAANQRPLAGATVRVRYQNIPPIEDETLAPTATTDEDGRFKLLVAISNQQNAQLIAHKDEYAEARVWRSGQARGEVQLKLAAAGEAFEGTVLTEDRQPVAGARVTYQGMQQEDPASVPETETDKDGWFSLPLPPWGAAGSRWNLVAVSEAHGMGYSQASVPPKGQRATDTLEITLSGIGAVKGVVSDAGGAPLAGAVVSLTPDWAQVQNRPGRGRRNWQLLNIVNDGSLYNLSAVSGPDGRYEIAGVPAMDYKLGAALGLDSATAEATVEVRSGETAEADIAVGEGRTIEGWVLDPEDKPIAGAYVNARPMKRQGYGWWMNQASARTQSDGRFVLRGIADETYQLSASASGFANASEKNIDPGTKDLRLVLRAQGWIAGIVRVDGSPYRGMFTVTASRKGSRNLPMRGWNNRGQTRTFNTDDGRFEFKGLAAGEYTVTARTPEGQVTLQPAVVPVVEGRRSREVRIELTEGAVLTGQVRDGETGRGLPNTWVYANAKPGSGGAPPNGYAQTDATGRYELKGLGTGAYTITVWVSGTNISRAVDMTIGERRQLDITRESPGTVTFTVVDANGNPIAGARPNLQAASGQGINVNMSRMRQEGLIDPGTHWRAVYNTNDAGQLTRFHVPPGVVVVWVTCSGYKQSQRTEVEVRPGSNTRVTVTLERNGS